MSNQATILLQGLVILVPIIITVYVSAKFVTWVDDTAQQGLRLAKMEPIRGLGLLITLGVIYLTGLLARTWVFRRLVALAEAVVEQIPLVKTLYSATKDLLQFLGGSDAKTRGTPARLKLMDGKVDLLVMVTQKEPEKFLGEYARGKVAVYAPMSYQLGGYTLYVNSEDVEELSDLKVEDLLKLSMTAGLSSAPSLEQQVSSEAQAAPRQTEGGQESRTDERARPESQSIE